MFTHNVLVLAGYVLTGLPHWRLIIGSTGGAAGIVGGLAYAFNALVLTGLIGLDLRPLWRPPSPLNP